jgi:GDP-L-fucose synthase
VRETARMRKESKIYLAGHTGLVGSAIHRKLLQEGYTNLVEKTIEEMDLTEQANVNRLFAEERPEYVFLAAARVGGIYANSTYPAEFIYQNLAIQTNIIHAAYQNGTRKLLFLGSSCIYPKFAAQPMKEESLLTGPLEPTNEYYAIAKIAGLKTVQAYRRQYGFCGISLMPTNLYGMGDNFDLKTSHVLAALIRKFHEAKVSNAGKVTVWGSGTPRREFLHVDDLADAALFLMLNYDDEEIINVGTGEDITVRELCDILAEVTGFSGSIVFDRSMPDGTPRKLLDVSRLFALGWSPRIPLRAGIEQTYRWYVQSQSSNLSRARTDTK